MSILIKCLMTMTIVLTMLLVMKCFYDESVCLDKPSLCLVSLIGIVCVLQTQVQQTVWLSEGLNLIRSFLELLFARRPRENQKSGPWHGDLFWDDLWNHGISSVM